MVIKGLIDSARNAEGYAGIAVCYGDDILITEGIDSYVLSYLLRMYRHISTGSLVNGRPGYVSTIIGGFTFFIQPYHRMIVVTRYYGRVRAPPSLASFEPDFTDTSFTPGLPSIENARHDAEAILKQLKMI